MYFVLIFKRQSGQIDAIRIRSMPFELFELFGGNCARPACKLKSIASSGATVCTFHPILGANNNSNNSEIIQQNNQKEKPTCGMPKILYPCRLGLLSLSIDYMHKINIMTLFINSLIARITAIAEYIQYLLMKVFIFEWKLSDLIMRVKKLYKT